MTIVWVHGLEGSPTGHKATRLRELGFELISPDGRGKPLADRVVGVQAALDQHPGALLVGSSYGGLASCWIASQRPLAGVLLLAPALHHSEPPVAKASALTIPETTPAIVLHGTDDTIVPIEVSRKLAARCPHVQLRELADGHSLSGSIDAIAEAIRDLGGGR